MREKLSILPIVGMGLLLAARNELVLAQDSTTEAGTIEWSSTGSEALVFLDRGEAIVVNDRGEEVYALVLSTPPSISSLSPDGKLLVYVIGEEGLYLLNLATNKKKLLFSASGDTVIRNLKWSPNSQKIALYVVESSPDSSQIALRVYLATPDGSNLKLIRVKTISDL